MKATRPAGMLAVILATLITVLSGCGSSDGSATDPASLDGTWVLQSFGDSDEADPTVVSELTLADGDANGSAGVNTFQGTYDAGDDGALTFSPLASTMMAGPDNAMAQEMQFLAALDKTESFALDGDNLVLSDGSDTTLAVLQPGETG